jgi:hypothetical protein
VIDRKAHLRHLSRLLVTQLHAFEKSRPRKFDAGLVDARLAAEDMAQAFSGEQMPEVTDALARVEATLASARNEPDLRLAAITFQKLRDALIHGWYSVVDEGGVLAYHRRSPELPKLSRRTRCATDLALRLLSPVDRQRYREEWAAELAHLPRCDQAPSALRLLSRAWSLRRELSGKPSRAPQVGLVVMVTIPGADVVAAACGLGWPAAAVGICWGVGVAWTLSSKERTSNLIDLIKAIRSRKAPTKE